MEKEKQMWFDSPTQVAFYDVDAEKYVGGIAYKNEIICGCCGGVFEIKEVYEMAEEYIKDKDKDAIIEMSWIDIENTIIGGERPEQVETIKLIL